MLCSCEWIFVQIRRFNGNPSGAPRQGRLSSKCNTKKCFKRGAPTEEFSAGFSVLFRSIPQALRASRPCHKGAVVGAIFDLVPKRNFCKITEKSKDDFFAVQEKIL